MLYKMRGVVLYTIPYNDKYSVTYMYTEVLDQASYLASRSRGKESTVLKALFIPLSVLGMEVEHLNKRDLHRIKETHICFPLSDVCCDSVKNVLVFFLSGAFFRVVKSMEPGLRSFDYLCKSIHLLEYVDKGIAGFHMVFLLGLLHHPGIFSNVGSHRVGYYSDMLNKAPTDHIPMYRHYLDKMESVFLSRLLRISFEDMPLYGFSRQKRAHIIHHILEYYRLRLPDFPKIESLSVMQSLFD